MWTKEKQKESNHRSYLRHREERIKRQIKYNKEHPEITGPCRKRYYKNHHDKLLTKSNKYQKEHKQENKKKWKKKYNSDRGFKNKVKQGVTSWRDKSREYYNFYSNMLRQGIKVNKKDFDKGVYNELRSTSHT